MGEGARALLPELELRRGLRGVGGRKVHQSNARAAA